MAVSVAPGMTALEASRTVPRIVPVGSCANAVDGHANQARTASMAEMDFEKDFMVAGYYTAARWRGKRPIASTDQRRQSETNSLIFAERRLRDPPRRSRLEPDYYPFRRATFTSVHCAITSRNVW